MDVIVSSVVDANHVFVQQPTHPTYSSLERLSYCMNSCYSHDSIVPQLPRPIDGELLPRLGGALAHSGEESCSICCYVGPAASHPVHAARATFSRSDLRGADVQRLVPRTGVFLRRGHGRVRHQVRRLRRLSARQVERAQADQVRGPSARRGWGWTRHVSLLRAACWQNTHTHTHTHTQRSCV